MTKLSNINHISVIRSSALLGKIIAASRKEHKLTQEALANRVGINRRTLAEFEKGKNPNLSTETLIKLIRILNLELTVTPRKRKNIHQILQEKAEYEQQMAGPDITPP